MSARWLRRLARTLVDGSVASALSTAVTIAESWRASGHPAAATNGASQWIWGTHAQRRRKASWRHTALGFLIHHASSLLWASVYESSLARRRLPAGARAVAVALLAAAVDYLVVPRRFTPGFEKQMTRPAIVATYAAFAAGLVLGSSLRHGAPARLRDRSRSARAHARRVR